MSRSKLAVGLSTLLVACTFGNDVAGVPAESAGPSQDETSTSTGLAGSTGIEPQTDDGLDTSGSEGDGSTSNGSTSADDDDDLDTSSSSSGEPAFPELCDDADPDLRACYDFEVQGQVLPDLSMYGNDASAMGFQTEAGPFGSAVRVDQDARIEVDDSSSLDITTPLSFEAWFYLDDAPEAPDRYGIMDNETQYALIIVGGGGIRCGAGGQAFAESYPTRQWIHVACVNDGTGVEIFVDGAFVSKSSTNNPVTTAGVLPMSIADTSPAFMEPLEGMLGGLRIWSVARTPEQIAEAAALLR